jgi:hypothetical protein
MAGGPFNLPHIVLPLLAQPESFKPSRRGGGSVPSVVQDRERHAQALLALTRQAVADAKESMDRRAQAFANEQNGYYLRVVSRANEPLVVEKFEQKQHGGVELLAVTDDETAHTSSATLFVPTQAAGFLEDAIELYSTQWEPRAKKAPKPKHRDLVEGIGGVSLATIRDLWIDPPNTFPTAGQRIQWEVWFRPGTTDRFRTIALDRDMEVGSHPLIFPEDVVILVEGSPEQMAAAVDATVSVSKLARAKKNSTFIVSAGVEEQQIVVDNLRQRIQANPGSQNTICVLDTGVNSAHPLLRPILAIQDCHSYLTAWGAADHDGHGTKMAGVCGFGDLANHLNATNPVRIPYILESVKIFPPHGQNEHDLLGAITAGGIARVELAQPARRRVFCLATSTDGDTPHYGRPTSWSAELDQLSAGVGEDGDTRRLICVSVGNIRTPLTHAQYLTANDLAEVESPAQAWNALSVGAFTDKVEIQGTGYDGWLPFGILGDLCPTSRTATWNKVWPIKPDFVLEGGNLGADPADGLGYGIPSLQLVTTSATYPAPLLDSCGETSAATAAAARICALIQAEYPNLWPETIRALIVGSAVWNERMMSHLPVEPSKTDHALLLKRYGFGIPDALRALHSARNALTLIEQDSIRPYIKSGSTAASREMKVYVLPWPAEVLTSLETEEVEMRVTLSYFIEPNPAESARNRKSRYGSHGLRFAVQLPDEDLNDFRKRINKAAREMEDPTQYVGDDGWVLGPNLRDRGSLHSDIWRGPAADLARRASIAVYPVGGWWKDRTQLERYDSEARFALIVSISTRAVDLDIDIYTPITNQIAIAIETSNQ